MVLCHHMYVYTYVCKQYDCYFYQPIYPRLCVACCMLKRVSQAAVFLQCEPLETLACAKIASLLIHKTPEQIRQTFDIVNDYTPEEEEAIRRENDSWLC